MIKKNLSNMIKLAFRSLILKDGKKSVGYLSNELKKKRGRRRRRRKTGRENRGEEEEEEKRART